MAPKPMKKFLVTYHLTAVARKQAAKMQKDMTPEMHKGVMDAWGAWAQKCGDQLVDMGAPIGASLRLDSAGAGNAKAGIGGYSVVQAKSIAGAKKLFRKHPHLGWLEKGCSIEIHEITAM